VIALALVSLLLWLVLRSVREVAFTLAPVVLSGFLTLGSCVLIGQPLNFANIIAFPLLFGVGVAFHIYFVMAWRRGVGDLCRPALPVPWFAARWRQAALLERYGFRITRHGQHGSDPDDLADLDAGLRPDFRARAAGPRARRPSEAR
jgi:hypothetical protein